MREVSLIFLALLFMAFVAAVLLSQMVLSRYDASVLAMFALVFFSLQFFCRYTVDSSVESDLLLRRNRGRLACRSCVRHQVSTVVSTHAGEFWVVCEPVV